MLLLVWLPPQIFALLALFVKLEQPVLHPQLLYREVIVPSDTTVLSALVSPFLVHQV